MYPKYRTALGRPAKADISWYYVFSSSSTRGSWASAICLFVSSFGVELPGRGQLGERTIICARSTGTTSSSPWTRPLIDRSCPTRDSRWGGETYVKVPRSSSAFNQAPSHFMRWGISNSHPRPARHQKLGTDEEKKSRRIIGRFH